MLKLLGLEERQKPPPHKRTGMGEAGVGTLIAVGLVSGIIFGFNFDSAKKIAYAATASVASVVGLPIQ